MNHFGSHKILRFWTFILSIFGVLFFIFFFGFHYPSSKNSEETYLSPHGETETSCLSPHVQKSLQTSEEVFLSYRRTREALVKSQPSQVNPWAPYIYPYDYFPPTLTCPFSLQRLGVLGDGGKWVCGIEHFQRSPCVLYSFGISNETSFELEILQKTTCEIFAFDASVDEVMGIPAQFKDRVHFSKLFGGPGDTKTETTLSSAMARYGHTHIDILKMDIEGNEFPIIHQIIREFGTNLPFTQFLLEIHGIIKDGPSFSVLYKFFEKLENVGLRAFRNELNISPMIVRNDTTMALCEYSFLNINRYCVL